MLMIDSGYKSSVVYEACRKFADPLCYPSKGMSSGNTGKYVAPKPGANGVRFIGDGFHQSAMLTDKVWLTLINSDKYKHMVQEGFRVDTIDQPGSLSLYGDDPHVHRAIAEHICDEQWNAVNNKFEGLDGKKSRNNHWLDCLAGCCAGAAMCGIKLNPISLPATVPKKTQDTIKNTVKMSSLRTKY
jgi:phage terminase large subunit GpA-like protein